MDFEQGVDVNAYVCRITGFTTWRLSIVHPTDLKCSTGHTVPSLSLTRWHAHVTNHRMCMFTRIVQSCIAHLKYLRNRELAIAIFIEFHRKKISNLAIAIFAFAEMPLHFSNQRLHNL